MSKNKWVIGITIIWLLCGFVLLVTYSKWNWWVLAGFATWVLAGGIGVAVWQIMEARGSTKAQLQQMEQNTTAQLQEVKRSTNAQLGVGIFQELHSKETMKIVSRIYHHEPQPIQIKDLSSYERKNIYYVLYRFEMLGALVFNGIIDKQLAIEVGAGLRALRCWYKLYKYIREERPNRGYFVEYYEAFARLSLDYFKKHHIQAYFYMEDEEGNLRGEPIDLITELKDELLPRSFEEIKEARKV